MVASVAYSVTTRPTNRIRCIQCFSLEQLVGSMLDVDYLRSLCTSTNRYNQITRHRSVNRTRVIKLNVSWRSFVELHVEDRCIEKKCNIIEKKNIFCSGARRISFLSSAFISFRLFFSSWFLLLSFFLNLCSLRMDEPGNDMFSDRFNCIAL